MGTEECGVCGERVSFSQTVHVMVHTHSEDGVLDYYVCQRCYEDDLRPLFVDEDGDLPDDETTPTADPGPDAADADAEP